MLAESPEEWEQAPEAAREWVLRRAAEAVRMHKERWTDCLLRAGEAPALHLDSLEGVFTAETGMAPPFYVTGWAVVHFFRALREGASNSIPTSAAGPPDKAPATD